jgi:ATP-dependent Clp protease ATP-binding subunit ClpA
MRCRAGSLGFSEAYGAREMERTIETLLAKPLAKAMLEGRLLSGAVIKVSPRLGQLSFSPAG